MTFDEELQGAFNALADCLRDEIALEVRDAAAGVIARVKAEREAAVEEAVQHAREDAQRQADADLQTAIAETHQRAAVELQAAVTEAQRLAEAELRAAVSDAESRARELAEAQASEAQARSRVELEQRTQQMIDAAVASMREQMRASEVFSSDRLVDAFRAIDRGRSLGEILDALVTCAGREAGRAGLLLARGDLRGWRFTGFDPPFEASTIVLSPENSGIIGEAARTRATVSADANGGPSAPAFAALQNGRQSLAVPVMMSGEVVAVLYADQGVSDRDEPRSLTWADTLELMARHAARCLESVTALKTVRVLTERPEISRAASPAPTDRPALTAHDEDDAARRYAKLLVSEIKLYHEAAVTAGRQERDLATRLAVEIERARVLYEQRIPSELRTHRDHFHDELVRTLAAGDASLLGQTA